MTKEAFKQYLKQNGYSVDDSATIPTIILVGEPEKVKDTFISAKLLANKVGYKHSISVKNLTEVNKESEENHA